MLGSDPVSALLGGGLDPRSPKSQWKTYLRQLVENGCATALLGPDVVCPPGAGDATRRALAAITAQYPPGSTMPGESSGKLADASVVETQVDRVNLRVDAYYRRLAVAVKGRMPQKEAADLVAGLITSGSLTPMVGLHAGLSRLVAVEVPDAAALSQWHTWAEQISGDYHERFTAPTVLDPVFRGGGRYLFRAEDADMGREFTVGSCVITSGDVVLPVPPSTRGGQPITRLGPCRRLPDWLRRQLHTYSTAA
ncbi:MAG: hypothetical protein WAV90_16490 [Gordonia amarae]